jgi:GTP-binding protein Era
VRGGYAAILGWTNVGKSTLLNRIVGEKIAAVADVPQTTRHRIVAALPVAGRGGIAFVDTPGLHTPRERMNRRMVEAAERSLEDVDVALVVVDASRGPGPGDAKAARLALASGVRAIGVLNKVDLVDPKSKLLPMMETLVGAWGLEAAVPVSARTGEGIDRLIDVVLEALPEGPPPFDDTFLTDQTERALAAEWIREKILHRTREEIPHATAVLIERWATRDDGLVEIEATILVERESQKGIVIGKAGHLLKEAGTAAREDLERLLEAKVFLRLRVEVRDDWRNDRRVLGELGLE